MKYIVINKKHNKKKQETLFNAWCRNVYVIKNKFLGGNKQWVYKVMISQQ